MTSSFTTRNRFTKQGTGDGTNVWGDVLNSGVFDLVDFAMDGWTTKAITADVTLSSANGTTDEARARVLKFTGTTAATVTVPASEKVYFVWNASSAAITLASQGGGTSLLLNSGDVQFAICDAVNVKAIGFAGQGLKAYIDSAILATTGSLPATTGNDGKALLVVAGAWTPVPFSATASVVRAGTSTSAALTPGDTYAGLAEVTLFLNGSNQVVTGSTSGTGLDMSQFLYGALTLTANATLVNPTNPKPGQTGSIRLIQDGTGSRALTFSSTWRTPGGAPALTATAGAIDFLEYRVVSASYVLYALIRNPTN